MQVLFKDTISASEISSWIRYAQGLIPSVYSCNFN